MRVIFAAGGTGGHLYPALSLADYIKEVDPKNEVLFVGSKYRLEATKVEEHGYDFIGLDIKTPSGNLLNKAVGYFQVFYKVLACQKIIDAFKPDVIIGFGGYTSYSMLKAGLNKKVVTMLHEQNSVIGKSNLVLAKKVNDLITCYEGLESQTNTHNVKLLGNPTSYQLLHKQASNLEDYGLSKGKKTILIVMGSQGSQSVDLMMQDFIKEKINPDYQYIYISGENYFENYQAFTLPDNVKVLAYENNLVGLIKACDLIVSRAGASALCELLSAHKVSVLIPSKYVTNNHQYKNAQAVVDKGAAVIVEENDQMVENLSKEIDVLLQDKTLYDQIQENTKAFDYSNAAKDIYDLMKEECENHGK